MLLDLKTRRRSTLNVQLIKTLITLNNLHFKTCQKALWLQIFWVYFEYLGTLGSCSRHTRYIHAYTLFVSFLIHPTLRVELIFPLRAKQVRPVREVAYLTESKNPNLYMVSKNLYVCLWSTLTPIISETGKTEWAEILVKRATQVTGYTGWS